MRLGILSYINSLPVTMALEKGLLPGEEVEVVIAPPAELNELVERGELDCTAMSSVAYLKRGLSLRKIPGFCISSDGPVQSVCLFSSIPLEELGQGPVWMTGESETSRALLMQLCPELVALDAPGTPHLNGRAPAVLRIGDSALEGVEGANYVYDLGELWKQKTGLPMVFAVWVAQPGKEERGQRLLEASFRWAQLNREAVLSEAEARTGMNRERLQAYYSCLGFRLDEAARMGLERFAKGENLCLKS